MQLTIVVGSSNKKKKTISIFLFQIFNFVFIFLIYFSLLFFKLYWHLKKVLIFQGYCSYTNFTVTNYMKVKDSVKSEHISFSLCYFSLFKLVFADLYCCWQYPEFSCQSSLFFHSYLDIFFLLYLYAPLLIGSAPLLKLKVCVSPNCTVQTVHTADACWMRLWCWTTLKAAAVVLHWMKHLGTSVIKTTSWLAENCADTPGVQQVSIPRSSENRSVLPWDSLPQRGWNLHDLFLLAANFLNKRASYNIVSISYRKAGPKQQCPLTIILFNASFLKYFLSQYFSHICGLKKEKD